jgi:hypothetical protein
MLLKDPVGLVVICIWQVATGECPPSERLPQAVGVGQRLGLRLHGTASFISVATHLDEQQSR